jgi:polyferredoxin
MRNPVKSVRRVVQVLFLLAFLWLVWEARWHEGGATAATQWFLRADPLAALVTWLAPTPTWLPLFYPAIAVLILTALLGRVYCGWICPLGTTIDAFDFLFLRKRKHRPEHLARPAWKYYLLGAALVAALFGTQLAWLADPIPLLTRTVGLVAYLVLLAGYNAGLIKGWGLLNDTLGLNLQPTAVEPRFSLNVAVLVVFCVVLGLSLLSRRYWCRSLCPLGALLAVVGRFGLLNRWVHGCVQCTRCVGECKMGAIPPPQKDSPDNGRPIRAECIQCFDCLVCPKEGITGLSLRVAPSAVAAEGGVSRRGFLGSVGLGALYGAAAATGGGRRATHDRLIRPPGAIIRDADGAIRNMDEREFRDLCLRCGACMKACITNGLQPAVVEAGFDGLFTPMLVPKIGHCEQSCTACGQVCPSGALGRFFVEEKKDIRIGLASVDQNRCLSWRRGQAYRLCLVCNEHCPYGAIPIVKNHDGHKAPFVDPEVCVGCGQCENVCPAKPEAAIIVRRDDVGL